MNHGLIKNAQGMIFLQREGKTLNCPFATPTIVQKVEKKMIEGNLEDVMVQEDRLRQCGSWCPKFSFNQFNVVGHNQDGSKQYAPAVELSCGSTCEIIITDPQIKVIGKDKGQKAPDLKIE